MSPLKVTNNSDSLFFPFFGYQVMRHLHCLIFVLLLSILTGCGGSATSPNISTPSTFHDAYTNEIALKKAATALFSSVKDEATAKKAVEPLRKLAAAMKKNRDDLQALLDRKAETEEVMKAASKELANKATSATAKMNDAWAALRKNTKAKDLLKSAVDEFKNATSGMSVLRRSVTHRMPGMPPRQ